VTCASIEETRLNHISFCDEQDLHYRGGGGGSVADTGGGSGGGGGGGGYGGGNPRHTRGRETGRAARSHSSVDGYREIETRDIPGLDAEDS
jgi:hypothetical protein